MCCGRPKSVNRVVMANSVSKYEFDFNVVLIATCTYKLKLVVVSTNEPEYVVKFQYCWLTYDQNFMCAYE